MSDAFYIFILVQKAVFKSNVNQACLEYRMCTINASEMVLCTDVLDLKHLKL